MIYAEDAATKVLRTVGPLITVKHASEIMAKFDIGFLPVVSGTKAVGVVTDRDIALKGIVNPDMPIQRIMSHNVVAVDESRNLDEVAKTMEQHNVRRVLVNDHEGNLLGVLSLDDLAVFTMGDETVGQVLRSLTVGHPVTTKPNRNTPVRNLCTPVVPHDK